MAASAAIALAVFWCTAVSQLFVRHPHEDAFILFRYVEHLARGHGIVYNLPGPPAEGATDFLWMLLLAAFVRLGIDVAVAAATLNAIGAALMAGWLFYLVQPRGVAKYAALTVALGLCVPFIAGAHAAYDGFSTQLYVALVLQTYCLYRSDEARWTSALPYSGLCLGLFRPDGVILAGAFVVLKLRGFRGGAVQRNRFIGHCGIALIIGASYFAWRAYYFGELLPLPLYVKSKGVGTLPGWRDQLSWLRDLNGPLPLLLPLTVLLGYVAIRRPEGRASALAIALGIVPGLLLFISLVFAYQSQNVDFRFQAPIFVILTAALIEASVLCRALAPGVQRGLWLVTTLAFMPALYQGKHVWDVDYMDSFAVRFGRAFPQGSMALTEAGRMAFWTDAIVHDMVGLNTPHTAKVPATVRYVESLHPDVVMYHVAGTLDPAKILSKAALRTTVTEVASSKLERAVRPPFRRYLRDLSSYQGTNTTTTKLGSLVLTRYLSQSDGFDAFFVKYGPVFNHVIGIRRAGVHADEIRKLIASGYASPYIPYASARRLGALRWACGALLPFVDVLGPRRLGLPSKPDCAAL